MRILGWTIVAYVATMLFGAMALVLNYILLGAASNRPIEYTILAFLSVMAAFLVVGFPFFAIARLLLAALGSHSLLAFGSVAAVFGIIAGAAFGLPDAVLWDASRFTAAGPDSSVAEIVRANKDWNNWYVFPWLSPTILTFWVVVGTGMGVVYRSLERFGSQSKSSSTKGGAFSAGSGIGQ